MRIREIPWLGLGGVYEEDDLEAVMGILRAQVRQSTGFFRLPEEADFEKAYSQYCGSRFASALNSCGTALDLAIRLAEIGPGDEVITTPLTFVATAVCATARGAEVIFADIDPVTYNLDPKRVEEKITEGTKAILPVHYGGQSADVEGFAKLREKYGVKIIYDAAHATGTLYKGRKIGGEGDMSCHSFQSNKTISTLGEGGMLTTDNEEYFEKAQWIKTFGFRYSPPPPEVMLIGHNYRMTKAQAAVGLTQLAKADRIIQMRRRNALLLNELLAHVEEVRIPLEAEGMFHTYYAYTIILDGEKIGKSRQEFWRFSIINTRSRRVSYTRRFTTGKFTNIQGQKEAIRQLPIGIVAGW